MFPPVVKDVRHVTDFVGLLSRAQREIIILRKIELTPKLADARDEIPPINREMTQIHRGEQIFRAPFRLEERRVALAVRAQSIFVAVENVALGMARDGADQFVEREGREPVIVIDAGDEIAGRQDERAIRIFGNTEILGQELDAQPRLFFLPVR